MPPGFDIAEYRRKDRGSARTAAKALAEAGQAGDVGKFFHALDILRNTLTLNGWTIAMRQIARLGSLSKEIQSEFAFIWATDRHPPCGDPHAFLDAMRVLFAPYRGPSVRLFRGASSDEAHQRKFYGVSWTSDPDTAHWFAKRYQEGSVGGVVLETMASPEAVISAPGIVIFGSPGFDGRYFENQDGERMYYESEYLIDGRRLASVRIAHRYRPLVTEGVHSAASPL
jgi:hypothetical protein